MLYPHAETSERGSARRKRPCPRDVASGSRGSAGRASGTTASVRRPVPSQKWMSRIRLCWMPTGQGAGMHSSGRIGRPFGSLPSNASPSVGGTGRRQGNVLHVSKGWRLREEPQRPVQSSRRRLGSTTALPRPTTIRAVSLVRPAATSTNPATATAVSSDAVHRYCHWSYRRASGKKCSPTTRAMPAGMTSARPAALDAAMTAKMAAS